MRLYGMMRVSHFLPFRHWVYMVLDFGNLQVPVGAFAADPTVCRVTRLAAQCVSFHFVSFYVSAKPISFLCVIITCSRYFSALRTWG